MALTFLENALNLGIFNHVPVLHSKLQGEFFGNLLSPTTERVGENSDLFHQISIRKYEDDFKH